MTGSTLLVGTRGGPRDRATEVIELVNDVRTEHRLRPLRRGARLTRAATIRARHLADVERLAHDGWTDALEAVGIRGREIAENIAMGYRDPVDVVRAWLNSPGHRRNLLDPTLADIGVAAAIDDDGDTWWAQLFAGPK